MSRGPVFDLYPIDTLRGLLLEAGRRYADKDALCSKHDGRFQPLSYREVARRAAAVASGLERLGVGGGQAVGLIGPNRTEWAVSYLGIVAAGRVVVPIDRDLKLREIEHILAVSEVRVVIASQPQLALILEARSGVPQLETVVSMDTERWGAELGFEELLAAEGDPSFASTSVAADELAALIFTSGTTGSSKAVMLSHGNLASNVMDTSAHVKLNQDEVLLSVLPLHHTYECTAGFLTALYQGATVYYAENLRRIPDNLQEIHASVMLGVPALFEAMYARIEKGIAARGAWRAAAARMLTRAAAAVGLDIRRRVYRSLHEKFGGRLQLLICGGAAVNPRVAAGFRSLGVNFIQGYGMTEHSPIISVNRVSDCRDASVGPPLPHAEVRIVGDEITVRGPSVMMGYFRDEAATTAALRSGWLYTGDLGYLDADGLLYINGRKKSVIVTPNGKNVYPEEVESLLNESPFILESIVWGGPDADPARTEVQAILVPDREAFDREFGASGCDDDRIESVLDAEVKRSNGLLAGYKRVKRFTVRREEFEKTTTRKIKRYLYTGTTRHVPEDGPAAVR